jgi:hypothetical protein
MNPCFIVDNRNIDYCIPPYPTVQSAIDAVCASGLARATICIQPSDYNENPVLPDLATCPTEIVFKGNSNTNESQISEARINGTFTVNSPTIFENILINGSSNSAVVVNSPLSSSTSDVYFAMIGCDLQSTVTSTSATLQINGNSVYQTTVRIDNSRIRNSSYKYWQ